MIDVAPEIFALLLLVGFVAGFIDAIAGGGGLLTLPVLIIAGAPPLTAIATNKVQSVFGSGMAAYSYSRGGHVNLWRQKWTALLALVAGGTGALLTSSLPTGINAWLNIDSSNTEYARCVYINEDNRST